MYDHINNSRAMNTLENPTLCREKWVQKNSFCYFGSETKIMGIRQQN